MRREPVVAVTAGDPCGVGPEVVLKTLSAAHPPARIVVIGDLPVFQRAAKQLRRRLPSWQVIRRHERRPETFGRLTLLDSGHDGPFVTGRSSAIAGQAALDYLAEAVSLWRAKRIQALVTAPVTKWAIARVLPGFTGQTEYLSRACGVRDVVMLFVSDRLRVALLTRHLSLSRVPRAVTRRLLRRSIQLTAQALTTQFRIPRPRLAVCGLNPHAGEESQASEERSVMQPVLRSITRAGVRCDGPFAADGLFPRLVNGRNGRSSSHPPGYDAVVCAYHDQGLIPFKMMARDQGCQLSVGLPLVRTSSDHGSALDIAGRGLAEPGSMRYALELAVRLAGRGA